MVTRAELQKKRRIQPRRVAKIPSGKIDISKKTIQQLPSESQIKEREALQKQIRDLEARDKKLAEDMQSIREAIAKTARETGSEPRAAKARLNLLSQKRSDLSSQLNILRTSETQAEAALRGSALKQQQAIEAGKKVEPILPETLIIEDLPPTIIDTRTKAQAELKRLKESPEIRIQMRERLEKLVEKKITPPSKLKEIVKLQDKWETATKNLDKFDKLSIVEQNKRLADIKKLGGKVDSQGRIIAPTIKIGVGKNKKEVSLSEVDARTQSDAAFSIAGILAEKGLIDIGEKAGLKDIPLGTIPEKKSIFFEPVFGTTPTDPLTGEQIFFKEKELIIPEKKLKFGVEEIAGGTKFGFDVITFVPKQVGALGEETIKAKGDITKVGQVIIKERKLDTAILGTLGIGKAVQSVTKPIIKTTAKGQVLTTRADEFLGKTIKFSDARVGGKVQLFPSERFIIKQERKVLVPSKQKLIEIQQPIVKGEKQVTVSKPVIFKTPELAVETQEISKKGAKILGKKAPEKIIDFQVGKIRVTETFAGKPIISGKPFILREAGVGKVGKLGEPRFTFVEGKQKIISFEEIEKLPKTTQFLVRETIRKTKGGVLREGEQIVLGKVRTFQPTKPLGRKTELQQAVAIVTPKGKQLGIEVFEIQVGSKGISKPFTRATGKVDTLGGQIVRLPTKDITPKGEFGVAPAQIKKTPLQTTFALPEIQTLKIPTKTKSTPTKGVISPKIVTKVKEVKVTLAPTKTTTATKVLQKQELLGKIRQVSIGKTKGKLEEGVISLPKTKILPKTKLGIDVSQKTRQKLMIKLKQVQQQRVITRTITRTTTRPKPKVPRVPVRKIIPLPKPESARKDLLLKTLKKSQTGYDVVIGQRKKKFVLRKNLPAFKALKLGRKYVDERIQATYRLVPSGRKPKGRDIKPFKLKEKFRPSKRNILAIVEKRKFRSDKPLEKLALRKAKRKKR